MASSNQFLVSMKFVGVDALSPEIKKITDQVKGLKTQMNSVSKGPSGGFKFLDDLSKGLKTASGYLDDIDKKLKGLKSSGLENMLVGGAMVAPVIKALDAAGQMQSKMVTISGATGTTDTSAIQAAIRQASSVTKFSSLDVADLAVKLATSGMTASQVQQLTPVMAKFAEVQQFGKGSSPTEATTQAISAAHMLGIYDPNQLTAYLDTFNKATFMTPGSTSEFFDTFKYLSPIATGLGMSNNDILYTSALANRVGLLGSMGGTEAADMILRSIPGIFGGMGHVDKNGKLKPSQQLKAMMDLGLAQGDGSSVFYNGQGQFLGIENFINQLSDAAKKVNPEQLTKDFKAMFGLQGDKLAVLFSERGGEQLQLIQQQMDNMKSITQMQDEYNKSYEGQLAQFQTNLNNLNQDVGNALLPMATRLLNVMQPYVDKASQWIQTHQDEVAQIGKVTAEFGAFLLVLGAGKLALSTIGSLVIDPLKSGVSALSGIIDAIKVKSATTTASKSLPEQSIQANIVNVYGKSVVGGGGVPGVTGGGSSSVILGPNGKPISSAATATEEAAQAAAKSGVMKNALTAVKSGLRGSFYTSLLVGGFDIAAGNGKSAAQDMGRTIGSWAGAEAGGSFGAEIGLAVGGPVGAAAGGIIGAVVGGFAGDAMVKKMTDALVNFKSSAELNIKADLTKYAQQEGEQIKQQYQSYIDNSTHNYNIQSSAPKEVANEVQSVQHNDGNFTKADWMRANYLGR